jgi:hypothetical protein
VNEYSGVRTLKYLCLLVGICFVAAALTGIHAVSVKPSGTTISHFNTLGRIWAVAAAFVCAAFAYGIHIRARIVWKVGFVYLALSYIYFVAGGITGMYHAAPVKDFLSFWLPVGLAIVLGAAVTVYWSLWWKRQRSYFP